MYLTSHQRRERLNKLNNRVKGLEESYMTCIKCNGTGLGGTINFESTDSIVWDGMTFCDDCKGWGTIECTDFVKKGLKTENFYIGKKK